mgnify:CR=1 FL=1
MDSELYQYFFATEFVDMFPRTNGDIFQHFGHTEQFKIYDAEDGKIVNEKVIGTDATVINPYYITGIDAELLEELKKDHDVVITLEDGILDGGFGEKIARFYGDSDMKVLNFGLKKEFLDRYDVAEVLKENHLTKEQIVKDVKNVL